MKTLLLALCLSASPAEMGGAPATVPNHFTTLSQLIWVDAGNGRAAPTTPNLEGPSNGIYIQPGAFDQAEGLTVHSGFESLYSTSYQYADAGGGLSDGGQYSTILQVNGYANVPGVAMYLVPSADAGYGACTINSITGALLTCENTDGTVTGSPATESSEFATLSQVPSVSVASTQVAFAGGSGQLVGSSSLEFEAFTGQLVVGGEITGADATTFADGGQHQAVMLDQLIWVDAGNGRAAPTTPNLEGPSNGIYIQPGAFDQAEGLTVHSGFESLYSTSYQYADAGGGLSDGGQYSTILQVNGYANVPGVAMYLVPSADAGYGACTINSITGALLTCENTDGTVTGSPATESSEFATLSQVPSVSVASTQVAFAGGSGQLVGSSSLEFEAFTGQLVVGGEITGADATTFADGGQHQAVMLDQVAQPSTQIVYGTGTGISSSPALDYANGAISEFGPLDGGLWLSLVLPDAGLGVGAGAVREGSGAKRSNLQTQEFEAVEHPGFPFQNPDAGNASTVYSEVGVYQLTDTGQAILFGSGATPGSVTANTSGAAFLFYPSLNAAGVTVWSDPDLVVCLLGDANPQSCLNDYHLGNGQFIIADATTFADGGQHSAVSLGQLTSKTDSASFGGYSDPGGNATSAVQEFVAPASGHFYYVNITPIGGNALYTDGGYQEAFVTDLNSSVTCTSSATPCSSSSAFSSYCGFPDAGNNAFSAGDTLLLEYVTGGCGALAGALYPKANVAAQIVMP